MASKTKEEKKESLLVFERRLLLTAFGCGLLATFLFILSFSSEFWVFVVLQSPQSRNDTRGEFLKTGHYHGLWKICREELWYSTDRRMANETTPYLYCRAMYFTLPSTIKQELRAVETQMLDFRRSTVAMGFVSLLLSSVAHVFTWYSLGQLRYMFKRLAACLQLITGVCVIEDGTPASLTCSVCRQTISVVYLNPEPPLLAGIPSGTPSQQMKNGGATHWGKISALIPRGASCWVTLEVFRQSIMYEELNMRHNVPEFSNIRHGWSYNLIWVCLVMFIFPGVVLFACSRKRKGRKARSFKEATENEPVHLGRI